MRTVIGIVIGFLLGQGLIHLLGPEHGLVACVGLILGLGVSLIMSNMRE